MSEQGKTELLSPPWCVPAGEGNECVVCLGDDPEYPGKVAFVVRHPIGTREAPDWDALNATTALIVKAVNAYAELTSLRASQAALVEALEDCKEFLDDEDIDLRSRVTNCQLAIDLALAKSQERTSMGAK